MQRRTRIWLSAVLAILATTATAVPSAARATPVRSGTIIGGTAATTQLWGVADEQLDGCEATPECAAWLHSSCHPALTGRDPAATTSIVNVKDLRGTHRVFDFSGAEPTGLAWGVVDVQLWRHDCTEIRRSRWASWHIWYEGGSWYSTTLRVPAGATWMTVTASQDTAHIHWTLT